MAIERMKRVEKDDAEEIHNLACYYSEGSFGLPQDRDKALELWHRAGELGHTISFTKIAHGYFYGIGMERDMKKATHYWELAAMGGGMFMQGITLVVMMVVMQEIMIGH